MNIQQFYPYILTGRDFEGFCAVMAAAAQNESEKKEWMTILWRLNNTGNVNVTANIHRPLDFSNREQVSEGERQHNVARAAFQKVVKDSGYKD